MQHCFKIRLATDCWKKSLSILRNVIFRTPDIPRSSDNKMFLFCFVPQSLLSEYWALTKPYPNKQTVNLTAQTIHDLELILAFITC